LAIPRSEFQLADNQLQFELAKLREDAADPAMDFGGAPGLGLHIGAERKAGLVDDAAHERRKARNADSVAVRRRRRKIPQDKHERDRFVVHRHDDGQFQAPPQLGDERTPAPL